MGTLRDYYIPDIAHIVDFDNDVPCPKLPARILLDDIAKRVSLNIQKVIDGEKVDCYTIEPYPETHHIEEIPLKKVPEIVKGTSIKVFGTFALKSPN